MDVISEYNQSSKNFMNLIENVGTMAEKIDNLVEGTDHDYTEEIES